MEADTFRAWLWTSSVTTMPTGSTQVRSRRWPLQSSWRRPVTGYWRRILTLRQCGPLLGASKPSADRLADPLGPSPALQPRKRYGERVS